ncbi:helix-turn-helix domain-containing protein [Streptomyces decoyicus]
MSTAPPTSIDALRVAEVMTALRLSRSKVYDLIRSRQLESFTIGRSRRIAADSLRTFITQQIEEAA